MAKIKSIVMEGAQGTLQNLTFVNSKRYGNHVRCKRGTIKPAVINKAFVLGNKRMVKANELARGIFHVIRDEHKDGSLWSRLLSILRKELKEGIKPSAHCLAELECNDDFRLATLLHEDNYSIKVQQLKNKMKVNVQLLAQPAWNKVNNAERYELGVVILYPNFKKGSAQKESAYDEATSLKSPKTSFDFVLTIPKGATEYALFLKITGALKNHPLGYQSPYLKGMRVVQTGVLKKVTTKAK